MPNFLILNRGCHYRCLICKDSKEENLSDKTIHDSLLEISRLHTEVFVGEEAFLNKKKLINILDLCNNLKLIPVLLTRGQFFNEFEELETIVVECLQHCRFKLILVLDNTHFISMGIERVSKLLSTLKHLYIIPEMIYLLKEGESLPTSLLEDDNVNQYLSIHCRLLKDPLLMIDNNHLSINSEQSGLSPEAQAQKLKNDGIESVTAKKLDYPVRFKALVIETTYFCNAKCAHCYTSCGPEVSTNRLPVDIIKKAIDEASILPNLDKRCHIGGGEATIFWNELIEILSYAKSKGFVNSIVTNGFWGYSYEKARIKTRELKEVGVETIEFSVDSMHQEFIPTKAISNIIQSAKEQGINIILRINTTRKHRASEVLRLLTPKDLENITLAISKVIPVGRAHLEIPQEEIWSEPGIPLGACGDVLNLTISPDGNVTPCCAGSELCPSLSLGNVYYKRLDKMMETLRGNFMLQSLFYAGPAYFAELIKEAGLESKLLPAYASYCHLCNHIFTNEELAIIVKRKINERITRIIDGLTLELLKSISTTEK
ncbi:MAG: radical SAM protein [Candidatus Nitrosocaldaceae archaeon]